MKVAIVNDSGLKVDCRRVRQLAGFFLLRASRTKDGPAGRRGVSARSKDCPWGEISLVLSNDSGIHSINRDFLGHDYPTDVISFAYDPVPGESTAISGEIVVNVELAVRLGARFGGPERELALYIAHGCDHLTGADDATTPQRRRMRARELRWLKEAEELGLSNWRAVLPRRRLPT
jgi:probable rRNA maturation factor